MKRKNEVERRVEGKRRDEDKLNETQEQKEAGPSGSHRPVIETSENQSGAT